MSLRPRRVFTVHEGRPDIADLLINREVDLVVNTPQGKEAGADDPVLRRIALRYDIPCVTNLSGALALVEGIAAVRRGKLEPRSLQEIHRVAVGADR